MYDGNRGVLRQVVWAVGTARRSMRACARRWGAYIPLGPGTPRSPAGSTARRGVPKRTWATNGSFYWVDFIWASIGFEVGETKQQTTTTKDGEV